MPGRRSAVAERLAPPAPSDATLLHRTRRRTLFAIGGAILGACVGLAGWALFGLYGTQSSGSIAIAVVALAAAGVLGGAMIGTLLELAIEDGEDDRLAHDALADPSAPIDEADIDDDEGRRLRASGR